MNNILSLETNKYALRLDNFEGPLDLLCYLIDKNKMDIYEVKISDIADQYVAYLKEQEELNLEVASEFIVMATTLILIKSNRLRLCCSYLTFSAFLTIFAWNIFAYIDGL